MTAPGPNVVTLRHGETEWSRNGQHTGRTDIDLTPLGEIQARAAGSLLAGVTFDRVLVSPLLRARHTAMLAGLDDVEIDDDLMEWDYGAFEGLTGAQIRETVPGWSIWEGPWRGGETAAEVQARVDRVVARALDGRPGSRVALVAHGHILRVLGARWVGAPVTAGRWLALDTAAVCDLGWEKDQRVLHRWNLVTGATMQE